MEAWRVVGIFVVGFGLLGVAIWGLIGEWRRSRQSRGGGPGSRE